MSLEADLFADRRVKSLARKLARRTAGPNPLPAEITVPATSDEWRLIAELGRILGLAGYQKGGKAVFAIPPGRRDPAAWADLRCVFERTAAVADESGEVFRRARLLASEEVVQELKSDEAVIRFVRRGEGEVREFLRMLEWAVERAGKMVDAPTTLSQTGSDILGDSKALRAGSRRMVFERVLSAVAGMDMEDGERDALARFGIEENPFTSYVTVFSPFSFTLETGEESDYPERMFHAGLAVQLPRQAVLRIREVRLSTVGRHIVTSENAAPFERMVRAGMPCLYTEGYPNEAVTRLLRLFAVQGGVVDHAGDGDLDGFLITDRISSAIPVRRVIADDMADSDTVSRRPVSQRTRNRWEAYLAAHGDFVHARALRLSIERGWPEQESYGIDCVAANHIGVVHAASSES